MIKLNLNENFICRIWEDSSCYSNLKTTSGKNVEINDTGIRNPDSGPDYYNAKIKIDGVSYSGCIEIHKSEKDWKTHKHKGDNKYNSVILQVVFYKDTFNNDSLNPVVKKSREIPTVILSDYLTRSVREIWKEIINNPSEKFRIPCYPENLNTSDEIKKEWLSKLADDRLELKTAKIKLRLEEISGDQSKKIFWEQVMFEFICEALGYSKNRKQFLCLSQKTDLTKIRKMKLSRLQTDSLLFGLSGFLKDLRFKDDYIESLKYEWESLKSVIRKDTIEKSEWNFFRLRPSNFPTIRIAYASALLFEIINNDFFKKIILAFEEGQNISKELNALFKIPEVSDYWKKNYIFGKKSSSAIASIGNERIRDITVNVILPLINLYSAYFDKTNLNSRVNFYYRNQKQKNGRNEITRVMEKQLNMKSGSIAAEQALIHLHNFYCVREECNKCGIGKSVFGGTAVHEPFRIILY